MTASGTTSLVQDNKSGEKSQQQVIQASTTWFPRSQLFYRNFTSDDSIKQEEFSQFAKIFKQQRLMMNYSGKDVAIFVQCSSATIHRFEALELSLWSMRKWKPRLQKWLGFRDDICHKHHKQRLCKIITTRVKFYFVDVF